MKPLPCFETDSGHLVRRVPGDIVKIEMGCALDIPVPDVPQVVNALAMCAGVAPIINTESTILDYLRSLGGFDGWWDSIDGDTQNIIRKQLARILIGPSR